MPASLVLRNGIVVDGTGAPGRRADVAIDGDRIIAIGEISDLVDATAIDVSGLTVAPGFINVLSHAWGSVQADPTAASDLMQGVTTEVFGESISLGPTDGTFGAHIAQWGSLAAGGRIDFDRLSKGLSYLETKGIAPNVASFVGGTNLRVLGAGLDDRPMAADELDRLRALLDEEMQEGALGVGTALIYAPGRFAQRSELTSLCEVVGRHDGMYISHLRSEGDQFLECLDELIGIGTDAGCRVEAYHLKAAGQANWPKMAQAIELIEHARATGQHVTADMYPYPAGSTSLASSIPPRFHVGGYDALQERLRDPAIRAEMAAEMAMPSDEFENMFIGAGAGAGILFYDDLADGTSARGRRLTEIAGDLGRDPVDALLHIVGSERGRTVAYFMMDEDNVRLGLRQPWVSFGSDAGAHQAIPPFTDGATHPRTYGTFARVLGHYSRDVGLFPIEDAVRRMTSLPADNLRLADRGRLVEGAFADIAVFDAATVIDRATFEDPHQYAAGMHHVVVNGVPVLRDGVLTHQTPGRRLRRAS